MAYTVLTDAEIAHKKPITLQQGRALRDNLNAAMNGDPGAPPLQQAAMGSWYYTAGGIGTYVFAAGPTTAFGATVAGSGLAPTSAAYGRNSGTSGPDATFPLGSALSGTWRCMGTMTATQIVGANEVWVGATLWLRIA